MQPGIKPVTQRGILMAEEGAGPWEAFISGHPGKVDRSKTIASDVVRMLGGQVSWNPDERLIAAMASGGVYGDWQAELRNVQRLNKKYTIGIRKDGTAWWTGRKTKAPRHVAAAIARLNAAQAKYEAAGGGDSTTSKESKHSQAYLKQKAREKARSDRERFEREAYEAREKARRKDLRENDAKSTKRPPGGYRYPGRNAGDGSRYTSSTPMRTGSSGPTTAQMTAAFTAAIKTMRPVVQIDGRTFYGVMKNVNKDWKGR